MRSATRVGVAVAAMLVCAASATSYRDSYKETNLGNGTYMVVVEVNGKTSYATARQYAFQRASEVCGSGGVNVIDADGNSYSGATVVTTQSIGATDVTTANQTSGGHDFTLLYSCGGGSGRSNASGNYPPPESLPRQ